MRQYSYPDILYAVSQLTQFLTKPTATHIAAARRVLYYLKGTATLSIVYEFGKDLILLGYSDANWAGDKNDRKSITGYIFIFAGGIIS